MKDLANGDIAIAVVNLSDVAADYTISIADYDALDIESTYSVKNLLTQTHANVFSVSSPITGSIPAHGCVVYRMSKQ